MAGCGTIPSTYSREDADRIVRHLCNLPAQPAHGVDRAPDLSAQIASLVRLLARQAAREHLHRLAQPDAKVTTDEP